MNAGATALEIAAAVRRRSTSAEAAVRAAVERAEAVQDATNAFIAIAGTAAIERARDVDRLVANGADLPLAGVPIVVKDNICFQGTPTTAGSAFLASFTPPYTATVVARLEAAGAVVVAKSNLDEFGMGSSNENSAFGPVRNPWDLDRVPGGSSGGSAVAVALGVAPLALGTDTGGSVRQPASFTGVLGYKPTYGLLSRYGVLAYASSLDQVGLLGRSTADVVAAMSVMVGRDPYDATSVDPGDLEIDLARGEIAGMRIGVVAELASEGNSADVLAALERTRTVLTDLGAEVVDVSLPHARYGVGAYYLVATAEASSNLSRYDGTLYGARVGADADGQAAVMESSRGTSLGPEVQRRILMGTFALSAGYYDAYYGRALRVRRKIADDVARAFDRVDVLLTPTAPTVAFPLGERTDDPLSMYVGDIDSCLANLAGIGAISVPAGRNEAGLPCGVQFMAPALRDDRLWCVAHALEARADAPGVEPFAPLAPDPF